MDKGAFLRIDHAGELGKRCYNFKKELILLVAKHLNLQADRVLVELSQTTKDQMDVVATIAHT